MRKLLPLLAVVAAIAVVGCSSEEAPKADTSAPATTYKMVPATTGGGNASALPAAAPSPAGKNPASPGSD